MSNPNWYHVQNLGGIAFMIRTGVLIALTTGFLIFPYIRGDEPATIDKEGRPISIKQISDLTKLIMQAVVSAAILCCALYIVLSHEYQAQDKHWAYGAMGTILGYWMKPK
jgi:hypothetical protein